MTRLIIFILIFVPKVFLAQDTLAKYYDNRIQLDENLKKVKSSFNSGSFITFKKVDQINPIILNFLSQLQKSKFTIADPGKPFNATDLVDNSLPDRRLISLYINSNFCFLLYEHGGIGFHYHLAWFDISNKKVNDFWVCNLKVPLNNIQEMNDFICSFDRKIKLKNGKSVLPSVCY